VKLIFANRPCGPGFAPDADLTALFTRLAGPAGREEWEVGLAWIEDEAMADLNLRYRDVAGITDVLSFSYLEEAGEGEPDLAGGDRGARGDLWAGSDFVPGELIGEIVIAPRFVENRCRENGWPVRDEFALLVVHGLLHVMGWDHAEPEETAAMREHEVVWLAREGVVHPLRGRGA